jgi:hypothetical protein
MPCRLVADCLKNDYFMNSRPSDGYTVKDWYKQNVYDPLRKRSVRSEM